MNYITPALSLVHMVVSALVERRKSRLYLCVNFNLSVVYVLSNSNIVSGSYSFQLSRLKIVLYLSKEVKQNDKRNFLKSLGFRVMNMSDIFFGGFSIKTERTPIIQSNTYNYTLYIFISLYIYVQAVSMCNLEFNLSMVYGQLNSYIVSGSYSCQLS